jgi:SAM-dependent methyltransferase
MSGGNLARFQCNVCSKYNSFPREKLRREQWSCVHCGSTVRFRSIVHVLSMELFGQSLPIAEFPHRPDLVGVGLSDWDGYANRLADKLSYTNTFFHKDPFLDITSIGPSPASQYDFIIASEVFEHVCQPVSRAFQNANRLLRPGGLMIFTVPYLDGQTREHFPDICNFSVVKEGKEWIVIGETSDGQIKRFEHPVFHGGPGTTVECRVFGKDALLQDCKNAFFDSAQIHSEDVDRFGIYWNPQYPEETPPWTFLKGSEESPDNTESHRAN